MEQTIFHAADKRGHADHGWLNAHHSFSFAGYHDPEKVHFGMLRVLNDDVIIGGSGFGKHPHDNMEIITIVLEGELGHKDSMGHVQTIVPDEVQVMSAGTGVTHSEYNHSHHEQTNLLQTWIFPNKRGVTPRYDQAKFPVEERINKLQTLVSPIEKDDAGLKIHQDAWIYRTQLEAGHTVDVVPHTQGHGLYIFVITGAASVAGQKLGRRDALGISGSGNVKITASETSDVLIFEVPMN